MKNKKNLFIALGSVLAVLLIALVLFLTLRPKSFTVSFDANGGSKVKEITVKKDETIELPENPVKEGYSFDGWLLNDKEFDEDTKVTKDIKLKAKWVKIEEDKIITVKFNSNGGTKIKDIKLHSGEELKLPKDPVKKGYKFITWKDDNETPISNGALLSEDITLNAYYEKEKVKAPAKKPTTSKPNLENPDAGKNDKPTDSKPVLKPVYYCEDGYTLKDDKCIKVVHKTRVPKCPEGTKSINNKCMEIKPLEKICKRSDGKIGVYLPEANACFYSIGTGSHNEPLNEENCKGMGWHYIVIDGKGTCYVSMVQGSGKDGSVVSSCKDGYEKFKPNDHSNPVCAKAAKPGEITYVCPPGFELNGVSCEKTITVDAKEK